MNTDQTRARSGLTLGAGAVLLWGTTAASTVWVGKRMGVWQFLAVAFAIAGLVQMACYLAMGRSLRSLLLPPPKLWLAIALGFVIYELLYVTALVLSTTDAQTVGVSLMNYLWPSLAVLFTVVLVPGHRMHRQLAVALGLSLAGVLLANGRDLVWPAAGVAVLPYVLGGAAAVCWAAYCALTSRWRDWAQHYASAPLGFLIVSAVAAVVCSLRADWVAMDAWTWTGAIVAGIGPNAIGYLFWELALHRAPGTTLGLLGSLTPLLSTLCLLGLFALTGAAHPEAVRYVQLLAASALIGAAVVLGHRASTAQLGPDALE